MKVRYRSATRTDRDQWVGMRHELWPECPVERHQLEVEQLLSGDGLVVIAAIGHSFVGFAEVSVRRDHVEGTSISPVPYLEGWYVRSPYRNLGVGSGLLRFVEQWAVERGFSELASDAEFDNALSIRVHNNLGFREVGRSVSFVKKLGSNKRCGARS